MRHLIAPIVLLACGCAAPALESASASRTPRAAYRASRTSTRATSEAIPSQVQDLVDRINRHRRELGCPRLTWDRRLAAIALRHSRDMERRQFFDHDNPDGLSPFDRIEHAGLRFRAAAENLAMGASSGEEVFEGWMRSRGHRRNLEDCVYTRVGIGLYDDYWTCVMAKLTPESTP